MTARVLCCVVLLGLAPAAGAAPRLSLEAAGAVFFRADPQGSLYDAEPGYGARVSAGLGDALSLPAPLLLDAGLLWYGSSQTEGPDAVQVNRRLHTLALPVRAGWTLGWRPWDTLRLAPYLSGGPAMTHTGVTYRIADPVGRRQGLDVQESSTGAWQAGGVYGAGFAIAGPPADIGVVGRIELLRLHRGPTADLALGFGVGAAF